MQESDLQEPGFEDFCGEPGQASATNGTNSRIWNALGVCCTYSSTDTRGKPRVWSSSGALKGHVANAILSQIIGELSEF